MVFSITPNRLLLTIFPKLSSYPLISISLICFFLAFLPWLFQASIYFYLPAIGFTYCILPIVDFGHDAYPHHSFGTRIQFMCEELSRFFDLIERGELFETTGVSNSRKGELCRLILSNLFPPGSGVTDFNQTIVIPIGGRNFTGCAFILPGSDTLVTATHCCVDGELSLQLETGPLVTESGFVHPNGLTSFGKETLRSISRDPSPSDEVVIRTPLGIVSGTISKVDDGKAFIKFPFMQGYSGSPIFFKSCGSFLGVYMTGEVSENTVEFKVICGELEVLIQAPEYMAEVDYVYSTEVRISPSPLSAFVPATDITPVVSTRDSASSHSPMKLCDGPFLGPHYGLDFKGGIPVTSNRLEIDFGKYVTIVYSLLTGVHDFCLPLGFGKSTYFSALLQKHRENDGKIGVVLAEPTMANVLEIASSIPKLGLSVSTKTFGGSSRSKFARSHDVSIMTHTGLLIRMTSKKNEVSVDWAGGAESLILVDESHSISPESQLIRTLSHGLGSPFIFMSATPEHISSNPSDMVTRYKVDRISVPDGAPIKYSASMGNILIFVNGSTVANNIMEEVSDALPKYHIFTLFASTAENVLESLADLSSDTPFCVIASDVAETGLTLDIDTVVDLGRKNRLVASSSDSVAKLECFNTTPSEASQRAGRCGRTKPGTVYSYANSGSSPKPELNAHDKIVYDACLFSTGKEQGTNYLSDVLSKTDMSFGTFLFHAVSNQMHMISLAKCIDSEGGVYGDVHEALKKLNPSFGLKKSKRQIVNTVSKLSGPHAWHLAESEDGSFFYSPVLGLSGEEFFENLPWKIGSSSEPVGFLRVKPSIRSHKMPLGELANSRWGFRTAKSSTKPVRNHPTPIAPKKSSRTPPRGTSLKVDPKLPSSSLSRPKQIQRAKNDGVG
jgi:hypothetical protein